MKRSVTPEALFETDAPTGEGGAADEKSGGTEVLGGLVPDEGVIIVETGRHAGERVSLGAGTCVIGRSSKCALVLRRSAGVSRRHAKIRYSGGIYEASDCGSRNGTRVNGAKIGVNYRLNDGDVIQISDERIRFRGPSGRERGDVQGLLVPAELAEKRLPSREQPGDLVRTQRVRLDSPDSLLMTQDGGTAPRRPLPPGAKNPQLPREQGALPSAPTALFTSQLDALRVQQPPPLVMPSSTTLPKPAGAGPPKPLLLTLGMALGVLVLAGGVTAWDLFANEGRVVAALEEDARLLWSGVEAAFAQPPPIVAKAGAEGSEAAPAPAAAEEKRAAAPVDVKAGEETAAVASAGGGKGDAPVVEEPVGEEPVVEDSVEKPVADEPVAEEPVAEQRAVALPDAVAVGGVVEVKATTGGRVRSVAVSAGDVVRKGDILLVLDRSSPRVARKLASLRREEAAFQKHASLGNARAQRDLESVRREIARHEKRASTLEVRADISGRVEGLLVDVNNAVKPGAVVVRIAVGG